MPPSVKADILASRDFAFTFKSYVDAKRYGGDYLCGMHGLISMMNGDDRVNCVFGPPKSGKSAAIFLASVFSILKRRIPIIICGSEHCEAAHNLVKHFIQPAIRTLNGACELACPGEFLGLSVQMFDEVRQFRYERTAPSTIYIIRYRYNDLDKILDLAANIPVGKTIDLIQDESDMIDIGTRDMYMMDQAASLKARRYDDLLKVWYNFSRVLYTYACHPHPNRKPILVCRWASSSSWCW
jgi:hypothetical protein